ncbi:MAG TPA: UbiD family decarboxylase [Pseudolabrys sp.]|jgi:4-hydroxy-3-polyprenylbenzoate decarboxylase|uniref:UbiD family decarboxylase n=1 Tax=Pseudolabrys sp. TaxID=1960880 RepID=UPI002DDD16F9|nr:UbiD family decarboxylase [Pseudolabrys sp.]HEV2627019.1 UbiD family decarboxylase [Pseudolabrys sp.]
MNAQPPRTVSLDLQSHLAELERRGLLVRVDDPIDKDTELHPLVRCQFVGGLAERDRRAFLFTNVVDCTGKKYDIPVVVGALAASPEIYSIGMGCPVDRIRSAWATAIANPIPPTVVERGSCQDVVITGEDLKKPGGGLARLPVPVSTPGFDAAPTLTATLCITKDPENGIANMSTNRAALKSTDRLAVRMSSRIGGSGGYRHWLKYQKLGQPMPCAIVVGAAPVIAYNGPQRLPYDFDELTVAGALAGSPIKVVRAKTIDVMVPADAEIVIEGLISTELLEPEGPFGESTGYVALEDYNLSMEVTAITHRKSPLFTSIISQVTPSESSVMRKVALEPLFLTHLKDGIGIRGIKQVSMHENLSNLRPLIFLQFAADTPRTEVWRGLQAAASRIADCGKIVIAVSEDVDPANPNAVFWSMAYRSNPIEDVLVVPFRSPGHGPSSDRKPGVEPDPRTANSTLLIDATLKHPMPPIALPAKPYMERAQEIWNRLKLPPVHFQAPWHGYALGDWSDQWEAFAQNAAAAKWEENGANTLARRRGGLKPETSVRSIED